MNYSERNILHKIENFKNMLKQFGFVWNESEQEYDANNILEKSIDELISSATYLAKIFYHSPESIYVADQNGDTIAVNKSFDHTVGVAADEVLGKNVCDLEQQGFFRPSIIRLVKEEKRPMSIMQTGRHGEDILVTGVPVCDEDGNLELLLSNARLAGEISGLYSYFREKNKALDVKHDASENKVIMCSKQMKRIDQLAGQIKDTDVTVLITGASGVGKGIVAKHIHNLSNRREKPMIEINCGAIPATLMESELFGYTGGAFTGASAKGKEGLIESANGGTLFLDEIGELPLALQVKLLKVLQDKKVQRIGSTYFTDVDVRIIAATNKDLKQQVKTGTFREDLYYRLNVIPIEIPPLKERQEDIIEAVPYFIEKFSKKYNRDVECTKEFMEDVLHYDWPGNMRELENYIERAVITSKSGVLNMSSYPGEPIENIVKMPEVFETELQEKENYDFGNLKNSIETLEGQIIRELYEKRRSSYKVAAELGISQSKAYRLIRKYCTGNAPDEQT